MPQKYLKKFGSRNYKTSYSEDDLEKAIKDVETGRSFILSVSTKLKI